MSGINRQLETSEIVSQIHTFNGNNATSYRLWMKHLRWVLPPAICIYQVVVT